MRTTLHESDLDALEAWVNEHADEFSTVAIYTQGLTMYRVGVPPATVVHHPGRMADALAEALASFRRRQSD